MCARSRAQKREEIRSPTTMAENSTNAAKFRPSFVVIKEFVYLLDRETDTTP